MPGNDERTSDDGMYEYHYGLWTLLLLLLALYVAMNWCQSACHYS